MAILAEAGERIARRAERLPVDGIERDGIQLFIAAEEGIQAKIVFTGVQVKGTVFKPRAGR